MKKYLSFLIYALTFFNPSLNASVFREASWDDIRDDGGLNSWVMANVCSLTPGATLLTNEEKNALTDPNNTFLRNLKTLSLKNQNIDDNFVEKLSKNPQLGRIINLDLSENLNITNRSLDYILESPNLGSIRDLPQISGRFGIPSSVIYLDAKQTSIINSESTSAHFEVYTHEFSIRYLHPITGSKTSEEIEGGVKFVEVSLR